MHNPPARESSVARAQSLEMLRRMLRIRYFEERATQIHAASQIPGPLHTSIGQEAEIVGACMAIHNEDYMTGNHRSHGHPIGKGAALGPLMAELFGKASGVCRGKGGSMHLAVFSVGSLGESGIVGAGMPVAAGAGLSAKLRGTRQVCLSFFGDGAANCGPFHESLNLAAIWKLPVIYLCENNGYAVTSSQSQTTAVADIAQRAAAYNIPGVVVDGQDVLAVHKVVSRAVERARNGEGPTLVEAKTYRYLDHAQFGGLKLQPYRSQSEIDAWRGKDPVELYIEKLRQSGELSATELPALRSEVLEEVEAAVQFAQAGAVPQPESLFEDVFA
jgi:acetoin:2,6-dichlorophenolindophenol oxidoreductase subunit alpha